MIGMCVICWSPETTGAGTDTGSFGVNNGFNSADGAPSSASGIADCTTVPAGGADSTDFIIIPNGVVPGANNDNINPGGQLNTNTVADDVADALSEFCGRYLNPADAAADASICSRSVPFKLGVRFDGFEATAGDGDADFGLQASQEASGSDAATGTLPLGTMGFSLG